MSEKVRQREIVLALLLRNAERRTRDLTGQVFGEWTVRWPVGRRQGASGYRDIFWLCSCSCGTVKHVSGVNLKTGKSFSCGCLKLSGTPPIHGYSYGENRIPEYGVWVGMRNRCKSPSDRRFKWYGARGIKVCERWDSFENFLADMGRRPEGKKIVSLYSIERINNDGNYEPGNCRWATMKEQAANRRHRGTAV